MHSDSDTAISAKNLSKNYRLFGHPGDRVRQFFSLGFRQYHRDFTALKDVSFEIKKGETVGIIGRNGSGKSTLLQLICGVLKPTSGSVRVNGRISALLELGAGFNPEFTGRENVYFQGALFGLSKSQIDARFDDIAAFADIGEFIDQPVRTYSSGMFLRLAFAVAVHVDPDILVVDEAIAVGDVGFRERCFGRIVELRRRGCTILFVSHDTDQIQRLCESSILLDAGELVFHGRSELAVQGLTQLTGIAEVNRPATRHRVREQLANGSPSEEKAHAPQADDGIETLQAQNLVYYPQNGAQIQNAGLYSTTGAPVSRLRAGQRYRCTYQVHFFAEAQFVRCAALIRSQGGVDLGGAWSAAHPRDGIPAIRANSSACVEFDFDCLLHPGNYLINLAVFAGDGQWEYALHGVIGAVAFTVEPASERNPIAHVDFACKTQICVSDDAA